MILFSRFEGIVRGVAHEFRTTPSTRSGFKIITVAPHDDEACVLCIDLDAQNTDHSKTKVLVKVEDAFRISTYLLNAPLVDLVRESSERKAKEKEDEESTS